MLRILALSIVLLAGCSTVIRYHRPRNAEMRGYFMGIKDHIHCTVTRMVQTQERGWYWFHCQVVLYNGAPRKSLRLDTSKITMADSGGRRHYKEGGVIDLPFGESKTIDLLFPCSQVLDDATIVIEGFVADDDKPVPSFRIDIKELVTEE